MQSDLVHDPEKASKEVNQGGVRNLTECGCSLQGEWNIKMSYVSVISIGETTAGILCSFGFLIGGRILKHQRRFNS